MVCFKLGQYSASQDLYARAFDIQSTLLGNEHADTATTMNNTAGLLKVMGDYNQAEIVYRTVCIYAPASLALTISWLT